MQVKKLTVTLSVFTLLAASSFAGERISKPYLLKEIKMGICVNDTTPTEKGIVKPGRGNGSGGIHKNTTTAAAAEGEGIVKPGRGGHHPIKKHKKAAKHSRKRGTGEGIVKPGRGGHTEIKRPAAEPIR